MFVSRITGKNCFIWATADCLARTPKIESDMMREKAGLVYASLQQIPSILMVSSFYPEDIREILQDFEKGRMGSKLGFKG